MKITEKFKARFPLFFLLGVGLIITNWILGGKTLAIQTGWRFVFGILTGIVILLIFGFAKRRSRAKRK